MEFIYNSDEEDDCEYCNPCYIFCESTGDDLCKPYKDRIFYNGASQFISPSITNALRSCSKALSTLSDYVKDEQPECHQRNPSEHANTCHCYQSRNACCQYRRNYEDSSRIVEVVDVSLSSPSLNPSPQEEPLVDDELAQNIKEPKVTESFSSNAEVYSSCEENCVKNTGTTSITGKEICLPCGRPVMKGKKNQNDTEDDHLRNININVKVRLHKRRKKSLDPISAPERKKCKCKRKGQGENRKDTKKKYKCEISKPIEICNRKPEPVMKFLHFFKCKNLDENARDDVGRLCLCKKKKNSERRSSEETISTNGRNIFIPTTEPIDVKNLSTILEESNKSKIDSDKKKTKNNNSSKIDASRKINREYINEPNIIGGRKEGESKNGEKKNKKEGKLGRSRTSKEAHSGNGKLSRSERELKENYRRKNKQIEFASQHEEVFEAVKDSGYRKDSLNIGDTKGSTDNASDVVAIFVNTDSKHDPPSVFSMFTGTNHVECPFHGVSHIISFYRYYCRKGERCPHLEMKAKFMQIIQTAQLPRNIFDRLAIENKRLQKGTVNSKVSTESRCFQTNFDYQQIYDLRQIFEKFEVYRQQQFVSEFTRLKQRYRKLHEARRIFKKKEKVGVLEMVAVHCILLIYFIIFVWVTFFY